MIKLESILLFVIVIGTAFLFLSTRSASYVGYYEDDAHYIILAKSLLSGNGYTNLDNPAKTIHTRWPPGFPIFLIPFLAVFGENYEQLKWANVFLTTLNTFLSYWLFRNKLLQPLPWVIIIFISTNQLVLWFASSVMSEPLFMFLSMSFMFLLSNYEMQSVPNLKYSFLIGMLLMACISVKIVGFLFLPILFLLGFKRHDLKLIVAGTIPTVILLLLPLQYKWSHWGQAFPVSSPFAMDFHVLGINLYYYIQAIIDCLVSNTIDPSSPIGMPFWILLFPVIVGIYAHSKKHGMTFVLYFIIYIVCITTWWSYDTRLLHPLLPFLYYFFLQGVAKIYTTKSRIFATSVLVIVLLLHIAGAANFFSIFISSSHLMNTPNMPIYHWLKKNTQPDDVILNGTSGRTYLLTGRHSLGFPKLQERYQMLLYVYNNNVNYACFSLDDSLITPDFAGKEAPAVEGYWRLVTEDPKHFKLVFHSSTTDSYIFKVVPKKEPFSQVVLILNEVLKLRSQHKYSEAIMQLQQAIKLEPDFYLSLNLLGITLVDTGKIQDGINTLKKSIYLYPSLEQGYVDLAIVYKKAGYFPEALQTMQQALALAQQHRDPTLVKYIKDELDTLKNK